MATTKISNDYERGEPGMTYAYFIDNTGNTNPVDNKTIFQYIQVLQLPDNCIIAEQQGERAEIQKLFNGLKAEDILIVRSIQDLGNNITQILRVLDWLAEHQIDLISVVEDYFTITDFKQFVADLYQFDCDLKEKARVSGYETALASGKVGRPKSSGIDEALRLYDTKKFTIEQVCKLTSVSQSTLYRALRDRQSKINN